MLLVGRSESTAAAAAHGVRCQLPDADVRPMACDLESLADVRRLAGRIHALQLPLHLLINNAGVSQWWPYTHSSDGACNVSKWSYLALGGGYPAGVWTHPPAQLARGEPGVDCALPLLPLGVPLDTTSLCGLGCLQAWSGTSR